MTRVKGHDEIFWDELLEYVDLESGDLAAAEARLAEAGEAPLTAEMVEEMVRHATHPVPVLRLRAPVVRRLSRVAAAWLATAMLAAAMLAVIWLWSGQRSRENLSYETAIELLTRLDQPEAHRKTAIAFIGFRILRGIRAVRGVRDDAESPPELASQAGVGLKWVESLLSVEPPPTQQTLVSDIDSAIKQAADAILGIEARRQGLGKVLSAIGGDISALRSTPGLSPELLKDRDLIIAPARRWSGR